MLIDKTARRIAGINGRLCLAAERKIAAPRAIV